MRFEKWQALGNDYLILERDALPFELTPARIRRLCEGHFGVFADGVLVLSRRAIRRTSPTCGSTTRMARRQSCRATARARRSCTCAGAAGPTRTVSRSIPLPGRSARRSPAPDTCTVDMGVAQPITSRTSQAAPSWIGSAPSRALAGTMELSSCLDRQPAVRDPPWLTSAS